MTKYGNYETADELFHTPFATVYTARPAGASGAAEFVVKVANPSHAHAPDEGAENRAADSEFLARAKIQQAAAAQGAGWAKIHERGTSDGTAFHVTDLYPRTAQKLISGRIVLNAAGLHHLTAAVARGLRELRDTSSQAHGNLKASNVLMSGSGEVAGARVVLTDPVRDPAPETEAGGDIYAVGALIYQLVMHRPFRHASWPVPDAMEWQRLGDAGDLWRTLCSSLLNPELPHRTDLDGLERSLGALEPGRIALAHLLWLPVRLVRRVPFGRAVAAILLLALGGAVAGGAFVHREEATSRQRVQLARDLWLDALRTHGSDLLTRCGSANGAAIIDHSEVQSLDLAPRPTLAADLSPTALEQARHADEAVDQIRDRLLAAYNQAGAKLRSIQSAYLDEGLFEGFASVEVAVAEPEPDDDRLLFAIRKRFRFADRLAVYPRPQMNPATAQHLAEMDQSGDKVLAAFAKALRNAYRTAAIPVTNGWQSTPLVDELTAKIAAVHGWPADYSIDRLKAEEHLNLDKATLTTITQWLSAVPTYAWVQATAQSAAAQSSPEQSLAAADRQARGQLMRFLTADSPLVQQYQRESADLHSQIEALSSQRFVRKDLPQAFDSQASRLNAAIGALPGKYKYQPADLADWLAKMRARTRRFTLPAAQEFWKGWMGDRGVDSIDAGWVRRTQVMNATLTQLDRETFHIPTELENEPWAGPVREFANQQLAKAIKRLPPDQTTLDAGELAQVSRQYATWIAHVEKLKQDYTDLYEVPITANTLKLLDGHWASADDQAFWHTEVENNGTFFRIMKPELDRIDAARAALKGSGKTP